MREQGGKEKEEEEEEENGSLHVVFLGPEAISVP